MGNPYLKVERLPNVLAAITALGTYKFYKLDPEGWSDRICGAKDRAEEWRQIFKEHPEFFRFSSGEDKVSLVWRRQHAKRYDVDRQAEVDPPDGEKHLENTQRISRKPLDPGELTALISVAVDLHARAVDQQKASKWWVPLAAGGLAFVGGLLGTLLASVLS